jgi:transcriptional regulator with XRE-family HTH domain
MTSGIKRDPVGPFADLLTDLMGNMSYSELARRTGIDRTRISRLMAGEGTPTVYEAWRIAGALLLHREARLALYDTAAEVGKERRETP